MTIPVQLPLFSDLPIPPRPKRFSEGVLEDTVSRIMPSIMKWYGDADADEEDEIRSDVKSVLEFEDDSYELTKELEDSLHWSVDRKLIDVLDEVGQYRDAAHKDAVYAWVVQNCVTPKIALEQEVQFRFRGKSVTGIVTQIYENEAAYCVLSKELGHVRTGIGVHGLILPYEDVEAIVVNKATEL